MCACRAQVRKHPHFEPESKIALVPAVVLVWESSCVALRNDAIDFFLL